VKPNNIEAYKWFRLAQLQGLADAASAITNCTATMSAADREAAESAVQRLQKHN
jgi:hypothetical protein